MVCLFCAVSGFLSSRRVVALCCGGTLGCNPGRGDMLNEAGGRVRLGAPAVAAGLPPNGFVSDGDGYQAPPADATSVGIEISETSERLARLEPFAAWDGGDYNGLPLLIKALGKCTTDHISMAGPWLKFRGHLDNISNNMLIGAVNAFNNDTNRVKNIETGEHDAVPATARDYKARGLRWVVVGDENYGEGSSREHAAMEPRHLGCAAVIVRSFARIHETNLKKQGVLPLTFVEPANYDLVQEGDRFDLTGLADLAPGSRIACVLHHADGNTDTLELAHTLTDEQVDWFRAGSALNKIKATVS